MLDRSVCQYPQMSKIGTIERRRLLVLGHEALAMRPRPLETLDNECTRHSLIDNTNGIIDDQGFRGLVTAAHSCS
jgi:hypothetical protein